MQLKIGRPTKEKQQRYDNPPTIKLIWKRGMALYGYKRNKLSYDKD
jgi:hypothetical protein